MCILCNYNKDKWNNIKSINCNRCATITEIPNIPSLRGLNCSGCPNLVKIPNLKELKLLSCRNCPKLIRIPDIKNLEYLTCDNCINLIEIPNLLKIQWVSCDNCPKAIRYIPRFIFTTGSKWMNGDIDQKDSLEKLIVIQRYVKKNVKLWRFKRYIKSREFNEWFYHPDNMGGKWAKKQIEKEFK